MTEKPGTPRAQSPAAPVDQAAPVAKVAEPGRLELNDRGEVTWQWTDEELLADNTLGAAERMRALIDPKLNIVDESGGFSRDPNAAASKSGKSGYNPYNSGGLTRDSWKKKKDLRQLSKWIELRKKMAEKKTDE